MHGNRSLALRTQEVGHEVGVALGNAERQHATSTALLQLLQRILGSSSGRYRLREGLFVELGAAPRDVPIVHKVGDPKIAERAQELLSNAVGKVTRGLTTAKEVVSIIGSGAA